jgi:hypothetical protein
MDYDRLRIRLIGELSRKYPRTDKEIIKDAACEAIARSLVIKTIPFPPEARYVFARTTAIRLLILEYHRSVHEPHLARDDANIAASNDIFRSESHEIVEWGIAQLPPNVANIVHQRLIDKIPLHRIAKVLGKKTKAVQQTFTRGLRTLRALIKEELLRGGGYRAPSAMKPKLYLLRYNAI